MKDLITLVNQLRRYDSGYIHDIARQAEERKTGPIFSNVTWTPYESHCKFNLEKTLGLKCLERPLTTMFLKLGNSRSGAFFWRIFSGVGQVDLLEEDEGDREILSSVAGRVFHAEEPVWTTD